jgi:hypothetical protein
LRRLRTSAFPAHFLLKTRILQNPKGDVCSNGLNLGISSLINFAFSCFQGDTDPDGGFLRSIENYIVDFYCPAEKLIIELDGSPHALASVGEADAKRDARLREMGFKVLRIENKYVLDNLPGILALITSYFAFSVDLE